MTKISNLYALTNQIYVNSSGTAIGIGTTTPSSKLEVAGSVMAHGALTLGSGYAINFYDKGTTAYTWIEGSSYNQSYSFLAFTTGGSEKVRIDSSGNFGIGVAIPSYKLDVNGTARISGAISGTSATFSGIITANSQTTAANGSINVESLDPAIRFRVTSGTANNRIYEWRAVAAGGVNNIMQLRLWNDAQTSASTLFTVSPTGAGTFSSSVSATSVALNGSIANSGDSGLVTIKQSSQTYTNGIYIERSGERNGYYMYVGGSVDSLTFRRNYFGTQSDVLYLTRDGLVGVGATPLSGTGSYFQVEQSGTPNTVAIRRGDSSNTGAARILWQAYNASAVVQNTAIIEAGLDGSSTEGYLALSAGTPGTPHMKLTYAGRVLIGIAASVDYLTKLRVHNATDSSYLDVTTPVGDATLRLSGTYGQIRNEAGALYISCGGTTGDMIFRTNNFTERMRINSSGSVGLGVIAKDYASTWVGLQVGNFALMGPNPGSDQNAIIGANIYRSTSNTWNRIIGGYGTVIELNQGSGDIRTFTAGYNASANSTASLVAGPYLINGGASWTNGSSDIRKKKNFEPSQGLAELLEIEAVKYHFNWDSDTSLKRLGFKAQNLQQIIPEMVMETGEIAEDGSSYLTITPDYILPVLVKAIQELSAKVTALENK